MIIIGEIVSVFVEGRWQDAEVLDITRDIAYVYVFNLRRRLHVLVDGQVRR